MPTDEVARVSQHDATKLVPQFVRYVAALGALAFLFGRMIGPALRGTGDGLDRIISFADTAGPLVSYLFAFAALSAAIAEIGFTFRERRFGQIYRIAATALGACVIMLVGTAFHEPLPERANIVAALASSVIALLASREAVSVPRTRAVGVLLLSAGAAALMRLSASLVAWYAGERALYHLAVFARVLATGSVFFDTLTLVVAFAWLTTRTQKATVWAGRIALFVGCVLAWGAARAADGGSSPFWALVVYRAVDHLLPVPPPYVWPAYRIALETCAPLLGIAAVLARGQMPAIAGAIALVLFARPSTDVPLSALALTLAALSTSLASRDDRGMWAVLMAGSRPPEATRPPEAAEPPRPSEPVGEPVERQN